MVKEAAPSDRIDYTVAGRTFRETAAYVASLIAILRQRGAAHPDGIPVSLTASGLSDEDRRVLR